MRISTIRIGTILILSLFAFTNINYGRAKKTIDPNLPHTIKEFPAQGESSQDPIFFGLSSICCYNRF